MIFPLALTLALYAPQTQHSTAASEEMRGSTLYRRCQAVSIADPTSAEAMRASICLIYVAGFMDGRYVDGKQPCVGAASYEAIAGAYVAWMKRHPEVMKYDRSIGMLLALGEAYPCTAK